MAILVELFNLGCQYTGIDLADTPNPFQCGPSLRKVHETPRESPQRKLEASAESMWNAFGISKPVKKSRHSQKGKEIPSDCSATECSGGESEASSDSSTVACMAPADQPMSKKSVQFNKRVKFRSCLHINDYSEEEIDLCWYSEDDFCETPLRMEV